MAKNRNQSQNRQRDQRHDQQRNSAAEAQEQAKSHQAEEHTMPAATQVSRKQQKRFGHN